MRKINEEIRMQASEGGALPGGRACLEGQSEGITLSQDTEGGWNQRTMTTSPSLVACSGRGQLPCPREVNWSVCLHPQPLGDIKAAVQADTTLRSNHLSHCFCPKSSVARQPQVMECPGWAAGQATVTVCFTWLSRFSLRVKKLVFKF